MNKQSAKAQTPLITVIVPVFNVAGYVAACLHSLRDQTFTNFEAIVVDDGSTDDSATQIRTAIGQDKRFKFIQQENRGLSGARNTGLDAAQGSYIAFVDSDDRVMPDYLQALYDAIEHEGADWVSCGLRYCFNNGTTATHSSIHGTPELTHHPISRRHAFETWHDVIRHFPSAWNKLYRKSLIDGLRFDEGTFFEDHNFYLRVAKRTDHIFHLPEALYLQTKDRDFQITGQDNDRVFEQFNVLQDCRATIDNTFAQGDAAFGLLAARLLSERSTAIRVPQRRVDFANASTEFLDKHNISYPEFAKNHDDLSLVWALEMSGELPLSVIIPWDGRDLTAVHHSLDALAQIRGIAHDVILVCTTKLASQKAVPIAGKHNNIRVLDQIEAHIEDARNLGIDHAKGVFVSFLEPGDAPDPWAYSRWVNGLCRNNADMHISGFELDLHSGRQMHDGFHDFDSFTAGFPPDGVIAATPMRALALDAAVSAKMYRRAFLHKNSLTNSRSDRWADGLVIVAALNANRIVYSGSSDIKIATANYAPKNFKVNDFLRAHAAAVQTIERYLQKASIDLPAGWQRRLYARAVGRKIHFAQGNKVTKAAFLTAVSLNAARLGFGKPKLNPAGLDPNIGPKQAALLDLKYLWPAVVSRILKRPISLPAVRGIDIKNEKHSPFHPSQNATLLFSANFSDHDYANIYLHTADVNRIPFHLSIRFRERKVVFNNTTPNGVWNTERALEMDLARKGTNVKVRLNNDTTTVHLNDQQIFTFKSGLTRQRNKVGPIDQIRSYSTEGGIGITELLPQPAIPDTISLDARLQILAHITSDAQAISVTTPNAPPQELSLVSSEDGESLISYLPGRVWRGVAQDGQISLTLVSDGQQNHPTLSLARKDVANRITHLLDAGLSHKDPALISLILEHVHHGVVLPNRAMVRLKGLANTMKLGAALQGVESLRRDTAIRPNTTEVALFAALSQFTNSQNRTPPADPINILKKLSTNDAFTPTLFLSLSEYFCQANRDVDSLVALAKNLDHPLPLAQDAPLPDPENDPWTSTALLPFLMVSNRYNAVADLISGLKYPTKGWVLTPPIAWTVRRALSDSEIPIATRTRIVEGFKNYILDRTDDYWDRTPCVELVNTAVDLLLNSMQQKTDTQETAEFCLRAYGLSRQFWRILAEKQPNGTDLPLTIRQAQSHFQTLLNHNDQNSTATQAALDFFTQHNSSMLAQTAIDILGPQSDPSCDLRAAASPGAALPQNPAAIADEVKGLYPYTPKAKSFADQLALGGMLSGLFAGGNVTKDRLESTLSNLIAHDTADLAFSASISLLGQDQSLMTLATIADMFDALAPSTKQSVANATAVRSALTRLSKSNPILAKQLLTVIQPEMPLPTLPNSCEMSGTPTALQFDTLVVVFSCRPYLETRIPALRAGWLSRLKDIGVPYIVIAGDGTGERADDIVYVDAPDDYEGLPQKTLAALKWVRDNTQFNRIVKVDDDCFLNVDLFFQSLTYQKFDYYGRKLIREPSTTDRAWHQEKSRSDRGKFEFDKSPEPSIYADGGSGYALSRDAIIAALDAAQSPIGQRLIQSSFLEDKLLGDLLALKGIGLNDEEYRVAIRRRSHADAIPVSSWLNSFLPSQSAPIMLAHLDTHLEQLDVHENLGTNSLSPRKVWPSYQSVRLEHDSNALDLMSPEKRVEEARAAEVAVVSCMRNEMFMLPHFLDHYRKLGVTSFLIADNGSDDGTLEYLVDQPDVAAFSVDTSYRQSHYGVAWQQALLSAFRQNKWSVVADADELLVWDHPQTETLPALLSQPDFATAEAVRIFMLDMYPQGPLSDATFDKGGPFAEAGFADHIPFRNDSPMRGPFSNQPAWTSALRHRLIPGSAPNLFVAQKMALLRYHPWMRLSEGLHFVSDVEVADRELIFAHFKYNAAFHAKAQTEVARGQHFNNAEEYRKYLALAAEGRDVVYEESLSAPWHQSAFVQARFK